MHSRPLCVLLLTAATCLAAAGSAAADPYPCGPSWMGEGLRKLIPQEVGGADFRPVCRRHDRCYQSSGVPRRECDQRFREQLLCQCDRNSTKPVRCRMKARSYYRQVRMFGGFSYKR